MSEVRVRVAPSPTGPPHVGTAYIALFNLAFAKQHGGRLVLRIEDTDQARSRPEYEDQLLASLRWLGLDWDEGPDCGGPHGPYRQSERLETYQQYARQLVEGGKAYYCFCTSERLNALRAEQNKNKEKLGYDGHCHGMASGEVEAKLSAGEAHVIRMRMPQEGTCVIKDRLRGEIRIDFGQMDDQVIVKSDGFPTYHLAVVVDDHLMGINHVIRGEEWINSTPKHLTLYDYFGWAPPQYAHLPLLLNPDRSKMSKRKNPTSIEYYRKAGYMGPALLNYLALMAYPPLGDEEKFSFEQLSQAFNMDKVSLGGSVFDIEKLNWLSGRYIREDRTPAALMEDMKAWLLNDEYLAQMIPLMQERMETLGDFMPKVAFFLARQVTPDVEDLVPKKQQAEEVAPMLQTVIWALDEALVLDRDAAEAAVRRVAQFWDWPIRDVTVPLIVAITGQRVGPPLFESVVLMGPDLVRARLLEAMGVLGGVSKKKASKLEKQWGQADG